MTNEGTSGATFALTHDLKSPINHLYTASDKNRSSQTNPFQNMTYDNFTINAQEAILAAQRLAASLQQQTVDTPHMIKGILEASEDSAKFIFQKVGVSIPQLVKALDETIATYPKVTGSDKQYLTDTSNKALAEAKKLLAEFGDEFISTEIMLLGIIKGSSKGAQILKDQGASLESLKAAIKELRGNKHVTDQNMENLYNALKKYGINLNQRALDGQLDPIIGRDEEIRRILHILSRRKKNNPILIGEAGVGKTAIVEGIAWRIVQKDVPENLLTKQIFVLDVASLIAGAKFKGEFEERIKAVVEEVKSSNGEVILFIDEIHTLIGAGGGSGAMDAANILKPALARGELRTIGATTADEYQKYFEEDKALVRRFQTVFIDEPSVEDTISILRGIQDKYETYHKIAILDEALVAAAELSHRYIADRQLPDKAIDLIDEAAAKLRLELDSLPEEIDEAERRLRQLEIEREAIKRENDPKKLKTITELIANTQEKMDSLKASWKNEKDIVDSIQNIKKHIDELEHEATVAERESNYEKVAKIRYGELVTEKAKLSEAETRLKALPKESRFTNEEVTADDIAEVVSKWTGIPLQKMLQSEKDKMLTLEAEIGKRLIGQTEAVRAVCNAVRRSRAGLQDPNKPIGSFIFLGPSGVGKTELAKALAEVLFDDENAITRIDMSEYQEKHSVSRLVGAPPGYVGYDEGGQLTEAIRRRPYSIVLLDEIEKAHPDTFNILLQVLDDGRLTDNKGRVANFKNTIIIMTSNMGSDIILENFEDLEVVGESKRQDILATTKEEVFNLLKSTLKPEFLNRIDDKIMFLPLTKEEIKKVAELLLKKIKKNLSNRDLNLEVNDKALSLLADIGYDPQYGARPLKRVIETELVNELAVQILAGKFVAGDTIYVDADNKGFVFSEDGYKGNGTAPVENGGKDADLKIKKRESQVDKLNRATKDVNDLVKDIQDDDNENEGDDGSEMQPKKN
jgi:ATP-dependent Clp protease ATP-binding subunit ClpB